MRFNKDYSQHFVEDKYISTFVTRATSLHEGMPNIEHRLELEVGATRDLCRQLLLNQERLHKFMEQQFNQLDVKLNDILTLLPAQHSVEPLPATAPLCKIHSHTPLQ